MKTTSIIDCTLREGKQSLQRALSTKSILNLSEKIISLGIDQLEVGHAAISKNEIRVLQQIKKAFPTTSLLTHARATTNDVEKAIEANVDWIGIFISTNEYTKFRITNFSIEKVIEQASKSVALAKANNLKVRFTVEDSSRTDNNLLLNLYDAVIRLGADRICLADTLGVLEPKEVEFIVHKIKKRHPKTPLEVHFHNDRGLAMANTLQAIESGAQWISSSVNGIGERVGITDTCLLLANLHYKGLRPLSPFVSLKKISKAVAATTRLAVDVHRPVVGEKAFLHVADLHVKAMKKNTLSYNWIAPELVGHQTTLIQPLPPFKTAELILQAPLIASQMPNEQDLGKHLLFSNQLLSDIDTTCTITEIPYSTVSQTPFTAVQQHQVDSYAIFIGKNKHLRGLTCEVVLDDQIVTVHSPATVFIPAGFKYAYRIMAGEGLYLNHTLQKNSEQNKLVSPENTKPQAFAYK